MIEMGRDVFDACTDDIDMDDVRALFRANTADFRHVCALMRGGEREIATAIYGPAASDPTIRPFELHSELARALSRTDVVEKCVAFGYEATGKKRMHLRYWIEEGAYPDIDASDFDVRTLPADVFNHLYLHLVHFPKAMKLHRARETRKRKREERIPAAEHEACDAVEDVDPDDVWDAGGF